MKCSNCLSEIPEGSMFCNKCGHEILKDTKNNENYKSINYSQDNNIKTAKEKDSRVENNDEMINSDNNFKKFKIRDKVKASKRSLLLILLSSILFCSVILVGKITDYTFSYKHYLVKEYNIKDSNGDTQLIRYIKENNLPMIQKLVDIGVNLDVKNKNEDNALLVATKLNNKKVVEILASKKADLNLKDKDNNTALLNALNVGNNEIAKILIDAGASIEITNNQGDTALNLAVKKGNVEFVDLLIKKGANINYIDNNKDTPVLIASKLKKYNVVELLINNKADITTKDANGNACIDIASQDKDDKLLKLLVANNKEIITQFTMQNKEIENSTTYNPDKVSILLDKDKIYDFYMVDGTKILYDKDGFKVYEGEIKNGKLNGYGIAYNGNGKGIDDNNQVIYKGNWKDGLWNGKGQSYWLKTSINFLKGEIGRIFKNEAEAETFYQHQKNTVFYDTTYENGYRIGNYVRFYQDGTLNDKGVSTHGVNNSDKYGDYNKINEVLKKEPSIGMTAAEVENSTWGKPKSINRTTTKYGTSEQWIYDGYRYIYLDNGIVTAIQNH